MVPAVILTLFRVFPARTAVANDVGTRVSLPRLWDQKVAESVAITVVAFDAFVVTVRVERISSAVSPSCVGSDAIVAGVLGKWLLEDGMKVLLFEMESAALGANLSVGVSWLTS